MADGSNRRAILLHGLLEVRGERLNGRGPIEGVFRFWRERFKLESEVPHFAFSLPTVDQIRGRGQERI